MQNDLFFFLGVFVFIFILWVATGGPDRPISFAGPYITPITDVGQTQVGYGSLGDFSGIYSGGSGSLAVQRALWDANTQLATLQKQAREQQLFGTPSPFAHQVSIQGGNLGSTDPDEEYLSLSYSYSAKQNLDITGWKLVSVATGHTATIRKGMRLYSQDGNASDIVLKPGEQALVTTGTSPLDVSFKENQCTGYLEHLQQFNPPLAQSCPSHTEDFNRFYTGNDANTLACKKAIENTSSCSTPNDSGRIPSLCIALIDNTYTYRGCVAHHQYDESFNNGPWRIYLDFDETDRKKRKDLWEPNNDIIKLLDANGYTVASYSY